MLGVVGRSPAEAAARWISVTSPHFEMYTTNSEKQAERALQTFEQVRSYFLQRSASKKQSGARVRVIAFSSEKEFKPYRLNAGSFAYYLQSRERDYIVMQDIESDHSQVAVHEYTHLIVTHSGLKFPTWLNEGLADLYSSLEPRGTQAMVGRPLPGHLLSLTQQKWLDWNTLLSVDQSSPYYNEREKMSIFYAQSWLLTHMLALSPAYLPGFTRLLGELNSGTSAEQAFAKTYGKTIAAVGKDVEQYIRQNSVRVSVSDITLGKTDLEPKVAALSDFQTGLALADLLASNRSTIQQAKDRLLALESENPRSPEVEESLGYLEWQQNNVGEARRHFDLAVEHGSKSVKLIVDDAGLAAQSGADAKAVVTLLEKAITLQPGNTDARLSLGQIEAQRGNFGRVLSAISPIQSVPPERAYMFFTLQAYSRANLKDRNGARDAAKQALQYAKTQTDRDQLDRLIRSLDPAEQMRRLAPSPVAENAVPSTNAIVPQSPSPLTLARDQNLPRIEGKTKAFVCGKNTFRLHLQVGDREMVFAMDKPQDILVRNHDDLQWSCGPLEPLAVTVVYQPGTDPKVDGVVAELIF